MLPSLKPFNLFEVYKFHLLTIEECQALQDWLQQRIPLLLEKTATETPIHSLPLNDRTQNALYNSGLTTVEDIIAYGLEDIHLVRSIGEKSAKAIKDVVLARVKAQANILNSWVKESC